MIHEDLKKTTEKLSVHLAKLQEERDERMVEVDLPDWAHRHTFMSMGWWVYEVEEMASKVNQLRAEIDKEPIETEEIARVDSQAGGHSDYSRKFAFYCAEIVHDLQRKVW